jgi:hypothetical protein
MENIFPDNPNADAPNVPVDPALQDQYNTACVQVAFIAGFLYLAVGVLRLGWVRRAARCSHWTLTLWHRVSTLPPFSPRRSSTSCCRRPRCRVRRRRSSRSSAARCVPTPAHFAP